MPNKEKIKYLLLDYARAIMMAESTAVAKQITENTYQMLEKEFLGDKNAGNTQETGTGS